MAGWPWGAAARALGTGALDSLRGVPGPEASVEDRGGGGYSHGTVVFGKDREFAAAPGRIALISTDTLAVHVLEPDGFTRLIIRRPILPEPPTQKHVDALIRNVVDLVFPEGSDTEPEDVANIRRRWETTPEHPPYPS